MTVEIINGVFAMQQEAIKAKKAGKTIGFVPTMGYLHEGHLTLVKKAKEENDLVFMSIFVNPLQFGPNEDFEAYPRDFGRDAELAEKAGVDCLFHPAPEEMYPNPATVTIAASARTGVLCGKSRPGHFDGVVTVLTKLFHIMMPDRAYFGLKDAQQVAVIEGLVTSLNFPLELVGVETVRESDGLAKSSRNVYLTPEEREKAPNLFRSLTEVKEEIEKGERSAAAIAETLRRRIGETTGGEVDYAEVLSYPGLESISRLEGKILIAAAVKFSKARLIDNIIIEI